jgi:phosphoserine phosphatase
LREPFTILSWYEYLADHGLTNGKVDPGVLHELYKRHRAGDMDYEPFAEAIVKKYAEGMLDQEESKVRAVLRGYARHRSKDLFAIARPIIRSLKSHLLRTLVITGSPQDAVQAECNYHRLGLKVHGTKLYATEGRYNGRVENRAIATRKRRVVNRLKRRLGAEIVISFGDSQSDGPLMRGLRVKVGTRPTEWKANLQLDRDSTPSTIRESLDSLLDPSQGSRWGAKSQKA